MATSYGDGKVTSVTVLGYGTNVPSRYDLRTYDVFEGMT